MARALWEVLGDTEVVLRNTLHDALTARHTRLGRSGRCYDDPAEELERHAHDDVAQIKRRLRRAGVPLLPGKVVAELPFGFWRFLLVRRYTASLWPVLRRGFPHLEGSDGRLLEELVTKAARVAQRGRRSRQDVRHLPRDSSQLVPLRTAVSRPPRCARQVRCRCEPRVGGDQRRRPASRRGRAVRDQTGRCEEKGVGQLGRQLAAQGHLSPDTAQLGVDQMRRVAVRCRHPPARRDGLPSARVVAATRAEASRTIAFTDGRRRHRPRSATRTRCHRPTGRARARSASASSLLRESPPTRRPACACRPGSTDRPGGRDAAASRTSPPGRRGSGSSARPQASDGARGA